MDLELSRCPRVYAQEVLFSLTGDPIVSWRFGWAVEDGESQILEPIRIQIRFPEEYMRKLVVGLVTFFACVFSCEFGNASSVPPLVGKS